MKNNSIKHWIVLAAACLMMGSAFGINLNINGIFLAPLSESLNRPMGDISFFVTLISMGIAFASFVITPVFERFSFKAVVLVTTIISCVAMALMGVAPNVLTLYILAAIRGFSAAFFGPVASQYLINNWFKEKHGMATSIVFSTAGIIGAIASPIFTSILENQGVQLAFLVAAISMAVMNSLAIFYNYSYHPEDEGLLPYGATEEETEVQAEKTPEEKGKEAAVYVNYKTYPFLVLVIVGLFVPAVTALVQHLAPMATDFGYSAGLGALLISSSMIANIISKLAIGAIADAKGVIFGKITMLAAMIIGLILLILHSNTAFMVIGAFGLGCVYSLSTVGISLITKMFYDNQQFSKVYPIISFIGNMGAAIAISLYGLSYDITQSYMVALWISLTLVVICLLLVISLDRYIKAKH